VRDSFIEMIVRRGRRASRRLRDAAHSQTHRRCRSRSVDLRARWIATDPYPHYEELRAEGTVLHLRKQGCWIVLGYEEVRSAAGNSEAFSNEGYRRVDSVLLGADPPQHTQMRRIVSGYFAPEALDRTMDGFEEYAESLLAPRFDLVSQYAVPLTEHAAVKLIGFDDEVAAALAGAEPQDRSLAGAPEASWRGERGDADRRRKRSRWIVERSLERCELYPRLLGEGIDESQARSLVWLFWIAATTTTERAIARCIETLLSRIDLRKRLATDEGLIPRFVEEVLRLHCPELMVPRVTTVPISLGGRSIPEKELVYLCLAAANRDPAIFENPAEVDLERKGPQPLSFGFGAHHCPGAALSRRETIGAVRTIVRSAPGIRVASRPHWWSIMTVNALDRMIVETGPE